MFKSEKPQEPEQSEQPEPKLEDLEITIRYSIGNPNGHSWSTTSYRGVQAELFFRQYDDAWENDRLLHVGRRDGEGGLLIIPARSIIDIKVKTLPPRIR